ncbi:MAG: KUP/HAK/KT family potassium transporter [Cephaloticoccus sp.]|nr:KUP/HAK/KT family potassium transporter [Cephaloticoccus sp.]MCF7759953.1 KUP/HAK/KT family potassium transporter [Cephaloticoccus sp.]
MDSHGNDTRALAKAGLALGALGVVFGDIGTSPLYALRESISYLPVEDRVAGVLGILSLIFWSLILVVSWKYLTFVTRADNNGEGGIFALFAKAKLDKRSIHKSGFGFSTILILFGACMLIGEGVITPAISVLSAAEGLTLIAPGTAHWVIPFTCIVLGGIFWFQSQGSQTIGRIYGPVMLLWFSTLGLLGFWQIWQNPIVLQALNPWHGWLLLHDHPMQITALLGAIVLAITGVEAIYADMGHFGRKAIMIAWYGVALPGLALNYFGQGAYVISHGGLVENPFLAIAPSGPLRLGVMILSVLAAIIASQALISGTFSLIRSSIQLGFFPRLKVMHTNADQKGQIYVPLVNISLAIGSISIVLLFKSSSNLAAAYGIAVTSAMTVTTFAFYLVARRAWNWPIWKAVILCTPFMAVDLAYLISNLHKFVDGGWLPIAIGTALIATMHTWKSGKKEIYRRVYANEITEDELVKIASSQHLQRVRGSAVFMAGNPSGTPLVLLHHVKANKVLHETVVLLSVMTEEVPYVADAERLDVREIGEGIWRAIARYGYMESPDVASLVERIQGTGVPLNTSSATYYFNREMIITGGEAKMWDWQKHYYAFLSRNARQARDYYQLPPMQIIEVGLPIQL